ncbi:MAG: nucleotidyl transferase AbiEii/AbiGii toxin family protein [Candidatus Nanopusillus sp.]|nr:nucleotidyl transferase AbiEii/AbiGii toxin family protein [Candidatus Nanopusillus sp.]
MSPQNSYKLSDRSTIRNLESILKILDDDKPVLIGGIAVAVYASYYGLPYDRKTKDIDFVINKNKKIHTKEIIYKELQNSSIREGQIFGYDGIEIIYKDGPSISILFKDGEIPYNEIKLKLGKKEIKLYVAKMEYLFVDKIFTYLNRKERKDLEDIKVLYNLMKKHGYDKELLYKIFNEYSRKYRKYSSKAGYIIEKTL